MVDKNYRNRLYNALESNKNRSNKQIHTAIANVILTNVDEQIVHAWYHLSDMGLYKDEFLKIRAIVKRRL